MRPEIKHLIKAYEAAKTQEECFEILDKLDAIPASLAERREAFAQLAEMSECLLAEAGRLTREADALRKYSAERMS